MMRLRRPSVFAVVLTLAGMAFFVRLGIWQLHRAHEKEILLARFAHATASPVVDFRSLARQPLQQGYPHVRVHGRYVPGRFYLLDDQSHAGRPGVTVYAPFRVDGRSRWLLVDLGFLPREGPYLKLPALPPLKPGPVTLTGLYAPPPPTGLKLGGDALARQDSWPKLTTYIDMQQVTRDLEMSLYPRVLLLDPDPAAAYVRQWTPTFIPPARHYGYAFQWFSFALAALVIFVILHRRKEDGEDDDE